MDPLRTLRFTAEASAKTKPPAAAQPAPKAKTAQASDLGTGRRWKGFERLHLRAPI